MLKDKNGISLGSDASDAVFAIEPYCVNVAGAWNFTASGSVTCTMAGETERIPISGSGRITLNQNACRVSWTDITYNKIRSGTVNVNKMKVHGEFVVPLVEGVTITTNNYFAKGTINDTQDMINMKGNGTATGTYSGMSFSCNGTDTLRLTRSSYYLQSEAPEERKNDVLGIFEVLLP